MKRLNDLGRVIVKTLEPAGENFKLLELQNLGGKKNMGKRI